ncbi:hypothetical protein [Arcobacter arenosus]|uniref:hypothetical protein n=1 Tax=Arcobacter arenosus TaxID=2576037 RepID=UPI003BA9593C
MKLIPIIYHNLEYPSHINANIKEVASHFDVSKLDNKLVNHQFSLHTEYSATHRNFSSELINNYPTILSSQSKSKNSKPILWISEQWAFEFADFIIKLLNGKVPKIIEIHPPNKRRTKVETFMDYYEIFRNTLLDNGIDCEISIENRNGFMLSGINDFKNLSNEIDKRNSNLKLILDFPQLLNFEKAKKDIPILKNTMNGIKGFKHNVSSFHIWGQKGRSAHMGDMSDYFNYNERLKELFYENIKELFLHIEKDLYFIPEINFGIKDKKSKKDCLKNIVNDLENIGFSF